MDETSWSAAINLSLLTTARDYDAFGCLFGVRNYAKFGPIAADRGLPVDVSDVVRQDHAESLEDMGFGDTWIGWDELKAVDWDEFAEAPDSRIHQYERGAAGELRMVEKAVWSRKFTEVAGITGPVGGYGERNWPDGTEWVDGTTVFRAERLRRRDALSLDSGGDWQPLWDACALLASVHGDENVRLVVWFVS
ncbi:hypothetical protein [Fodinicola feengrottensis]|uniref:hypothetical protein n=1 Tax=Fodinicola feengrottensis TaxID=435914 RepID=UPI002442F74A|nr:hypothetical protein [Fodinicola feengrottensis]